MNLSQCHYLMLFDQSMIIDATKGSIARFINHSCKPNCRMVKWIVGGNPRMALFAGDEPIMTGDELTYDYNFDPFSTKNIQKCLCGSENCRGVLGPKPKDLKSSRESVKDIEKNLHTGTKRKIKDSKGSDDLAYSRQAKRRKSEDTLDNKRSSLPDCMKLAQTDIKTNKKNILSKLVSRHTRRTRNNTPRLVNRDTPTTRKITPRLVNRDTPTTRKNTSRLVNRNTPMTRKNTQQLVNRDTLTTRRNTQKLATRDTPTTRSNTRKLVNIDLSTNKKNAPNFVNKDTSTTRKNPPRLVGMTTPKIKKNTPSERVCKDTPTMSRRLRLKSRCSTLMQLKTLDTKKNDSARDESILSVNKSIQSTYSSFLRTKEEDPKSIKRKAKQSLVKSIRSSSYQKKN